MKISFQKHRKIIKITLVIILALICLGYFVWFIITAKQLYRQGYLKADYHYGSSFSQLRDNVTVNDIRPWMTFDYLNVVFKLNPTYLKNTLNIIDPRYPNIRIDHYAKYHNINSQVFFNSIKQIIISYPNTK